MPALRLLRQPLHPQQSPPAPGRGVHRERPERMGEPHPERLQKRLLAGPEPEEEFQPLMLRGRVKKRGLVGAEILVGDAEHVLDLPDLLDVDAQAPLGRHPDHDPVLRMGLVEGRAPGKGGLAVLPEPEVDVLRAGAGQLGQNPAQVALRDRVAAPVAVVDEAVGPRAFAGRQQRAGGRRDPVGDIQPALPDVDGSGPRVGESRCRHLLSRRRIRYRGGCRGVTAAGSESPRLN